MEKKSKIRFMITSLAGGGAEKVFVDLLKQLDPKRYEITLLTITQGVHASNIPETVNYRCILPSTEGRLQKLLFKLICKLPPKLFTLIFMREENDIEIAYLEGIPTRFVAAKKARRKIAFVHCDISSINIIAPYYKDKEECLKEYQSFSKVCFVSDNSKEGFECTVGSLKNSCVIHNVVDYKEIKTLAEVNVDTGYGTSKTKLLAIGRLSKEKGFDRLLRVVAELEKLYEFELLIVGEGKERENLERMINEKQIQSVKLVGFQSNPYAYMNQADLLVCSSLFEGYSTVVTEAMALGLPVVTTCCAGMDEILEHGKYGLIVDNDEAALKEALQEVLKHKEVFAELKEAALEKSKRMSEKTAIAEYETLFQEVIAYKN